MPYIKETIKAGKTIEITKSYSGRYGNKNIPRSGNRKKTPEQMKTANLRHAEKTLRITLNENFRYGDIHFILTYFKESRPDTKTARKQIDKFLRDLRKLYRSLGMVLKYVLVTEYLNEAIHHHIVVNSIDSRLVQDLWPYGSLKAVFLYSDADFCRLAEYLIKETDKTFRNPDAVSKRRWRSSKNLRKPQIKKEVIRSIKYAEEPKPVKGYYILKDSIVDGINPVTGYPYQSYRMIQIEPPHAGRKIKARFCGRPQRT